MRLKVFYLSVALLTFIVALLMVLKFHSNLDKQAARAEKLLTTKFANQSNFQPVRNLNEEDSLQFFREQKKPEKRFCRDKRILPVWNELKKDEYFREQGNYGESGNCVEMIEMKTIDLNRDGHQEILLRGRNFNLCGGTGNCGFWIFEKKGGKYRKILSASDYVDITEMPDQVRKSMTRGYFDILLKGHVTAADTSFNYYKFDGKRYKQTKCLVDTNVWQCGNETPERKLISCREFYKNWK